MRNRSTAVTAITISSDMDFSRFSEETQKRIRELQQGPPTQTDQMGKHKQDRVGASYNPRPGG